MKRYSIRGRGTAAIAASIEAGIAAGAFVSERPLPPIRRLAASLRVSPVTVAAAYRLLQSRGLVVAGGRRGTRVRPAALPGAPRLEPRRSPDDLTDLETGNPDPALLPPLDPALRSAGALPRLYGGEALLPALARFAAGEFEADGIPARAMTIVSGALDAIQRLLAVHLRPGDRVAVEDPGLPGLLDLLGSAGYRVLPVPIDAQGPRPDGLSAALARGARAVIVTPRAQNPTGAAISATRAAQIAPLLRSRGELLVIENDPAGPVAGVAMPTLSAGARHPWAVVRSVSKYLGPDLRLALIAGDELTIARVERAHALGPRWVSHLLQQVTLALWSDPASGRRLARAADLYALRRAALGAALAGHGIHVTACSGFNVWIPVREETSAVQALAAGGWAVAAGERFRIASGPAIRVTAAALGAEMAVRFAADCAAAIRPTAAASA